MYSPVILRNVKVRKNQLLSLSKSKDFLVVYLLLCDLVSLKKNDTRLTLTKCQGSRMPAWVSFYAENELKFA